MGLDTLLHSQRLEVLLNIDKFQPAHDVKENESHIVGSNYRPKHDNTIIRLDVILICDRWREFKSTMKSIGLRKTTLGTYYFLGYGTNSDKGKFYFPKNVKFSKVKIKAKHLFRIKLNLRSFHSLLYNIKPNLKLHLTKEPQSGNIHKPLK